MRRLLAAGIAAVAGALLLAAPAAAHPLGNFSTNQLVQAGFDERETRVHYILDLAEIPTFQQIQRYDTDGDEVIGPAEEAGLIDRALAEAASGIELRVDGRPVALVPPSEAELSFPDGQGGLLTTRLEADFTAPLPGGAERVELTNNAYPGTQGWKAVQVVPGEGTDVTSDVPATDPTDGLTAYPEDLLESPLDQREAAFELAPGTGEVTAPDGPAGSGGTTTDRAQDGFAGLLTGADTGGILILFLLGAAFGWGALHALAPGHGKSMVAGYLAGTDSRPRHAVILGVTVTITHTFTVFAFGLIILAASQFILPEQIYPWLGVASGLMVLVIGFTVMAKRFRRWREMRAEIEDEHVHGNHEHSHDHTHSHEHGDSHAHDHGHSHGHGHAHSHEHDHSHGHSHEHDHSHGEHGHSHHLEPGEPVTLRALIALGVSGGLVPCPSALVVLIAAISQHRVGLGMALIFAFSVGLAATLIALGLAVLWGGRRVRRMGLERRFFGGRIAGALPALSAMIIVLAGLLITLRAIPQLG